MVELYVGMRDTCDFFQILDILLIVRDTPEVVIPGDDLVHCKDNAFNVIAHLSISRLLDSDTTGTVKVEDDDAVSRRVYEEVSRRDVLMRGPVAEIQVVGYPCQLLEPLELEDAGSILHGPAGYELDG